MPNNTLDHAIRTIGLTVTKETEFSTRDVLFPDTNSAGVFFLMETEKGLNCAYVCECGRAHCYATVRRWRRKVSVKLPDEVTTPGMSLILHRTTYVAKDAAHNSVNEHSVAM